MTNSKQACISEAWTNRFLLKVLAKVLRWLTKQHAFRWQCWMCLVRNLMLHILYTAPIIQDSMLPPLLGNRTLRKMQVIMDCGSGKLILPGPGGVEVKMSPGSKVFDLELTSSGHWVLPLYARNHSDKSSADDNELAFNMSCRRDRSKSPPRRRDAASN